MTPHATPQLSTASWTSTDGKTLPYQQWPGPAAMETTLRKPRGVIICVHGLSGASSDFWPAGEALPTKGFVVYGMELRGMGNDPVKADHGNISDRSLWVEDLLTFTQLIRKKHPNVPLYWFGESLGALISVHAAAGLGPKQSQILDGLILTSPVIAFRQEIPWWKYWPLRGLIAIWPSKRIMLEDLGDSEVKVTSETTHSQQMEKTPHYVPYFTLRLFGQLEKFVRGSDSAAEAVQIPFLLLYTPNDVFTTQEQLEAFFARIPASSKTKHFFPKSYHLLLHDVERETALEALSEWLEQQSRD